MCKCSNIISMLSIKLRDMVISIEIQIPLTVFLKQFMAKFFIYFHEFKVQIHFCCNKRAINKNTKMFTDVEHMLALGY